MLRRASKMLNPFPTKDTTTKDRGSDIGMDAMFALNDDQQMTTSPFAKKILSKQQSLKINANANINNMQSITESS